MKIRILVCAFICSCLAETGMAQQENGTQDVPEVFIFDGKNTSFAYGRAVAGNRIAVGLTDEGVYELRGDSAVWLVNHPDRDDEQVCIIIDNRAGSKFFVSVIPDGHNTPVDTVCVYNPDTYTVFDVAGNITGNIKPDGTVASPQGHALLLNMQSVDKLLAAFFFAYHYTPVRKKLKFSAVPAIPNYCFNGRSS